MLLHNIAQPIRYWRNAQGVRLPVRDLEDSHIMNIIRRFGHTPRTSQYMGEERARMLSEVIDEATKRGIYNEV